MNFLEAAEVAKQAPGSMLHRGESGQFVVRMPDGRIISSPDQFRSSDAPSARGSEHKIAPRLAELERLLKAHSREREIDRREVDQLRLEVNSLKEAIAKIPSSEWVRYEQEHRKLEREQQAAEAARLIGLARSGQLSSDQLTLIADNAARLGIDGDDLRFIKDEILRKRPLELAGLSPSGLVVYSTTDGQ